MEFDYDSEKDSFYIYLDDDSEVTESVDGDDIVLDYDGNKNLVGIEILNAKKILSQKIFEKLIKLE